MQRLVTIHSKDLTDEQMLFWLGLEVAGYVILQIAD